MAIERTRQRGVALIEILVTSLVIGVALLGLGALVASGFRYSQGAELLTIGVTQARDMADRMRANLEGVAAGYYAAVNGSEAGSTNCYAVSSVCTPAQVAAADIYAWNAVNDRLPGGNGTVTCNTLGCPLGAVHTIVVSWNDPGISGPQANRYVLSFAPMPSSF